MIDDRVYITVHNMGSMSSRRVLAATPICGTPSR
jgi:hypothetical protein